MFKMFMEEQDLLNRRPTKGELARELYPENEYSVDFALPQTWLDMLHERGMDLQCEGTNLVGHFVTVYPKDGKPAFIAPLTFTGIRILSLLAMTVK